MISKLDHLKDLGITAAWLSPVMQSPQRDLGYDISDYKKIEPDYGDMTDFENLVTKCHELGIKLLLDFIPNHTSDQHEWFKKSVQKDSEYSDYYVWLDGLPNPDGGRPLVPNNWVSAFHTSAWEWNDERQQYYLHQFLPAQPDLNYRNPKVVEAMKNVLRFWMSKGINGFRIDAVPYLFEVEKDADGNYPDEPETGACNDPLNQCYLDHIYTQNQPETFNMVTQWRAVLDEYKQQHGGPTRVLLVEAYAPLTEVVKIYGENGTLNGAQAPFNFEILNYLGPKSDAKAFKNVIDNYLNTLPNGATPNWVQGNHDQKRSASRLGRQKADAVNILLQVLPGIAVTYYGEELGMTDVFVPWNETVDPQALSVSDRHDFHKYSRDPARTPMIWDSSKDAGFSRAQHTWLPVPSYYKTENVQAQSRASKSHLKIFKKLTQLRKEDILMYGDYESKLVNDDILLVKRELKGDSFLLAAVNLGFVDGVFNANEFFTRLPSELSVVTCSLDVENNEGDKVDSAEIFVAAGNAILFSGQSYLAAFA